MNMTLGYALLRDRRVPIRTKLIALGIGAASNRNAWPIHRTQKCPKTQLQLSEYLALEAKTEELRSFLSKSASLLRFLLFGLPHPD